VISRALSAARPYLRDLGGEPAVALLGASALLVVGHHQGSTAYFAEHWAAAFAGHPAAGALPFFYWFFASVALYLGAPLLLARVTRGSFHRAYGLGLGDAKAGALIAGLFLLVMVPAVVVASRWQSFAGTYPLAGPAAYTLAAQGTAGRASLALFAAYEAAYFLYFVGWEFLFRGYLLNALLPRFGRAGAILIPTAPFVLMHLGKPELEALGAAVAGVALGILALRTRSFWYGAALHGTIAVLMDAISARPYLPPL